LSKTQAFAAATTNVFTLRRSYEKSLPASFPNLTQPPLSPHSTTMTITSSLQMRKRTRHRPPPSFKNGKPFTKNSRTRPPTPLRIPTLHASCPLSLTTTMPMKTKRCTSAMYPSYRPTAMPAFADCANWSGNSKRSTSSLPNSWIPLPPQHRVNRPSAPLPTIYRGAWNRSATTHCSTLRRRRRLRLQT